LGIEMIALLTGTVVVAKAGEVVLDVGGVGYRVRVPEPVGSLGAQVTLHTHLAVREDALDLYGFVQAAARDLFETLLGVTGVGPKLALQALGTLGVDGLRRAVMTEDVTALTVIPGVGRKGAQRIILELGERLGTPAAAAANGSRAEVGEALVALGYGAGEAQEAIAALPDDPDAPVEELLRQALRTLGSRV
jgi:Holliday junction DNA helicase RuvA